MQRFVLIRDDDCHWYVCPADKQEEASAYFDKMANYWDIANGYEGEEPDCPEWLECVGGAPSLVKFSNYEIRN